MATILDELTKRIHRVINDDSVARAWGRREISAHHGTRRIIWTWTGGRLEQPTRIGGYGVTNVFGGQFMVTSAMSNKAIIEAHIGAEDQWTAEDLWVSTLLAVQSVMNTASQESNYEWVTETDEGAAHVHGDSAVVIQQFIWDLGVVRFIDAVTKIESATHTCSIDPNL
jgi:hypothetical protein